MGWKERSHEDFSSGLGDLLSTPGNGTISVTGGKLRLYAPPAVSCDWWTSGNQLGPTIYRDFGHYKQSGSGIYMVEIGAVSRNHLSGANTYSAPMLIIEKDPANYRLMQGPYLNNTDWFEIGRLQADSWIANWSGDWGSRYLDGWYRIYINAGQKKIWVGYSIGWLNPGEMCLAFSRTTGDPNSDQSSWNDDIWRYAAPDLFDGQSADQLNFRFVLKTWSSFPEVELLIEDLYVYEWEDDELRLEGDPSDPEGGATRSIGAEDSVEYKISGQYEFHTHSGNEAPRVDRPTDPIAAGMEDAANFDHGAPTVPQQRQPHLLAHAGAYIIGDTEANPGDRSRIRPSAGFSDDGSYRNGPTVQFRQDTLDPYAHPHFSGLKPYAMFYYRTAGEPWANPTVGGFTGYARDGDHYTGGVLDPGPVVAPWAQESSFPSGNRSSRKDFPQESLLVVTNDELVIYDLDNWPTTLSVWMRFLIANVAEFYMLGRYDGYVTDVSMANGTLAVSMRYNGTDYGGIVVVNFKNDGTQHCAHMIRSDNHWWWSSGFDIRNRNEARWTTSGVPVSLRVNPEYMYSVSIYDDHNGKVWVACGGEDYGPQILGIENEQPSWMGYANGPPEQMGAQNAGDTRRVLFDESGWLWYSIENRLYRAMFDYKGGVLIVNQANRKQRGVTFKNETIRCLAQGRNYVYVGTDRGVYRVHKGTLQANLAYTIVGGGGGGLLNNPPDGEVLAGTSSYVIRLHCISTDKSSILQVTTGTASGRLGGVTTIRLTDDYIIAAKAHPDLPEDYIFVGASTIGV